MVSKILMNDEFRFKWIDRIKSMKIAHMRIRAQIHLLNWSKFIDKTEAQNVPIFMS